MYYLFVLEWYGMYILVLYCVFQYYVKNFNQSHHICKEIYRISKEMFTHFTHQYKIHCIVFDLTSNITHIKSSHNDKISAFLYVLCLLDSRQTFHHYHQQREKFPPSRRHFNNSRDDVKKPPLSHRVYKHQ